MHIQFYVGIIMCDMYVWQKDDERKTTEILKNDMEIKNQIEWKFIEAQCEMAVAGVWGWGRQMRWFKISFTPPACPRVLLLLVLPPARFIKFHLLYYKSIHIVICCGWCVLAAISRRLGKTITTNHITNTAAIGLVILPRRQSRVHTPQTDVLMVGSVVSRPFAGSQPNNWWLCFPFTLICAIPYNAKGGKDMKYFWWTSHPMPANTPIPNPKHD